MNKLSQGFNIVAKDLNLSSHSRESEALALSHCVLQNVCMSTKQQLSLKAEVQFQNCEVRLGGQRPMQVDSDCLNI